MSSKAIQTRISLKSDTIEEWGKNPNFIPFLGEICIYIDKFPIYNTDGSTIKYYVPGIKIGDGITNINNLPFTDIEINNKIEVLQDELDKKASSSIVTASTNGLVPKASSASSNLTNQSTDWIFANKNGTIGWYKLPTTAFSIPAAGNSLGGVKTGGDVSITGGVITVNQASEVKNNLIIKFNGGSSENTNLFTFNGSIAKTVDITPDKIGAMAIGSIIDGGIWS